MIFTKDNIAEGSNIVFIAALSALFSQVYMGVFVENFNVSFGIVALIIFFYEGYVINKLETGILCGVFVYILRVFIYFLKYGGQISYLNKAFVNYFPETMFYIGYVIAYMLFSKRVKNINKLFLYTIVCDFFGNILEMLIRSHFLNEVVGVDIYLGLCLVAIVRSFFLWIILNLMNSYSIKLLKKEHKVRYMNLLMATSRIKSEIYLMEKSMENIEAVMTKAYNLYNEIKEVKVYPKWEEIAVDITKDIHEIKKEMALVTRGITEIAEDRIHSKVMTYYDIIEIINEIMCQVLKEKNIKLHIEKGQNFRTIHHYYLISLFRNIINNAIDALENHKGNIYINHDLINKGKEEYHLFTIIDNGKGINNDDIEHIFSAGFSTKINFETGSINRGLGLSIVKDIVELKLKGNIIVKSEKYIGTEFTILIPKLVLEEE